MQYSEAIKIPARLSDEDLVREVRRLAQCTRGTTAILVAHLAELEGRRLHLAAGYPSLFAYCTAVLRLSEHEAYHRIEAARLARRFPIVLQKLAEGSVTLTTARLLSSQMTEENRDTLLAAAEGRSKREVEVLLARMFPAPDVPQSIRKVPAPRSSAPADGGGAGQSPLSAAMADGPATEPAAGVPVAGVAGLPPAPIVAARSSAAEPSLLCSTPAPARSREVIRPLAADRYEIRFTASAATREKLQLASDLLRHSIPGGDVAEIVDRALTALLEDLAKKKFAATARPAARVSQAEGAALHGRHVPARVKRAVWLRDGGRCAFVADGGGEGGGERKRCRERGFLEFHHVHPYAEGGQATLGNIELRCRAHNDYEATLFYRDRFAPVSEREAKASSGAGIDLIGSGHRQLGPDRVEVRSERTAVGDGA